MVVLSFQVWYNRRIDGVFPILTTGSDHFPMQSLFLKQTNKQNRIQCVIVRMYNIQTISQFLCHARKALFIVQGHCGYLSCTE